jgi:hypothetical protein
MDLLKCKISFLTVKMSYTFVNQKYREWTFEINNGNNWKVEQSIENNR